MHVGFTNDKFTKIYLTFLSLDGAIFSGRGRNSYTTQYRVRASENSSFDFKFKSQWASDGIKLAKIIPFVHELR